MAPRLSDIGKMIPFGGDDGTADANLYLGMVAVTGGAMWAVNAGVYQLTHSEAEHGHAQHAVGVDPVGPAGAVTLAWLGLAVAWVVAGTKLDREVSLSGPLLVWLVVTVLGFGANVAGFFIDAAAATQLMWVPWFGSTAVGYLTTGVLVQRSGVYYVAGVISTFALVVALGLVPVRVTGLVELSALTFLLLGALHTVPMVVDAARGGRQVDEYGRPVLRSGEEPSVTVHDD